MKKTRLGFEMKTMLSLWFWRLRKQSPFFGWLKWNSGNWKLKTRLMRLWPLLTPQPHRLVCMLGYLANFSNLVSCLHWIRAILLCRVDVSNLEHAPLWKLIPEKTMKYVMHIFCCRIWRTAKKWGGFRNLVSTIVGVLILCSSCQLKNSSKRIGHVILTLISRLFLDLLNSICACALETFFVSYHHFFRQIKAVKILPVS